MNQDLAAALFAFSSVLTFSTAAIGFTYFSQKVSPLWMNVCKALVSFLVSVPIIWYLHGKLVWSWQEAWFFYVSGFIGLNVGDWLLLSAYKRMGPARTLVLFGFQPFIVGTFSYFVWSEKLYPIQFVAIIFFVICLFLFSYEKFKKAGHWEIPGLLFALGGVSLDSIGVILTRYGFNLHADFGGLEAQYIRTLGALLSFVIYVPFVKIGFMEGVKKLSGRERSLAVLSSFFGTFLSLGFYLHAVKLGKLAMVTAVVLTDPMMSTVFESVWLKVWPSRFLWLAMLSFFCAMFCLFYPQLF